jgi:hypothetical protein
MKWFNEMLSNDNNKSSARLINFIGAINGGALLTYETSLRGLSPELFAIYLSYCGCVYGFSKYFDKGAKNGEQ